MIYDGNILDERKKWTKVKFQSIHWKLKKISVKKLVIKEYPNNKNIFFFFSESIIFFWGSKYQELQPLSIVLEIENKYLYLVVIYGLVDNIWRGYLYLDIWGRLLIWSNSNVNLNLSISFLHKES